MQRPIPVLSMDEAPKLPPAVPVAAKARKESPLAQFSDKIGKAQIIEKEVKSANSKTSSLSHGFHCSTCNATFTSSDAFLDHCNGRVHARNSGLTLKVERVDEVARVKARLQLLTEKRTATESIIESKSTDYFEQKLDTAEAEMERLKEERKNRKKMKKESLKATNVKPPIDDDNVELDTLENGGNGPSAKEEDLMALMGFKSFS